MSYNSKYKGSEVENLLGKAGTAVQPEKLAKVATSGSYNDLEDKPTIPSGGGGEQVEEPFVLDSGGVKFIAFADTTVNDTYINTPMMPGVTYVCTEPVDAVILHNIQLPTGNIGKYTLHFAVGESGGYIDFNPDLYLYSPNGELNTDLEPFGIYELSIVATKLVENGATYWLYKAVLTQFTY